MSGKVNVALIGCGFLGKWHLDKAMALNDLCVLRFVVEPNKNAWPTLLEKYPNLKIVSTLDEIINDIDAAIVATPTSLHYSLVKQLLEKNKHVFCEKPLTSKYSESLEIQNLSFKTKRVVQVGHSERFHEVWDFKDKFSDFFSGDATIRMNRLAPFKGRATDVDVVQDLMIHDLDLLVHLFNEKPKKVRAIGHKIRTDKWDYVSAQFFFRHGKDAFITVGRNHIKEVRDLEVTNKVGCFHVDLFTKEFKVARFDQLEVETKTYSPRDHLLIEQREFYNSILNNRPAIVDVHAGVTAVLLVEKVLESLEKNETVEI